MRGFSFPLYNKKSRDRQLVALIQHLYNINSDSLFSWLWYPHAHKIIAENPDIIMMETFRNVKEKKSGCHCQQVFY